MPIVMAQPSPVAPGISSAYGAAEEYDRNAPTVLAYRQQQLQGQLAGASAYQHGIDTTTQRTVAAGQQQAAISEQQAAIQAAYQHQAVQAAVQQGQQQFEAQAQADAQQRQAQNQAALQDQRFQQQVQANQIELSQAEEARLTRYKNADADVDRMVAEGSVKPDEAVDMKAHIRGLKGPLELRQVKSQAMAQEAQAAHVKQIVQMRTDAELESARVEALSFDQRYKQQPDPGVLAGVLEDMGPPPADPAAKAAYQKEALRRVAKLGGMQGWYLDPKKGWVEATKHEPKAAAAPKAVPFDPVKSQHYAQVEADAAYPPTLNEAGKEVRSPQNYETKFKVLDRLKKEHEQGQPGAGDPTLRGPYQAGGPAAAGPQPQQPAGGPAFPSEPIAIDKPLKPEQKTQFDNANAHAAAVMAAPIPPEQKQALNNGIVWYQKQLIKHGSLRAIEANDPEAYKRVVDLAGKIDRLPKPDAPPAARGDVAGAVGKFGRGELITLDTLKDKLSKLNKGELVTSDDVLNLFK